MSKVDELFEAHWAHLGRGESAAAPGDEYRKIGHRDFYRAGFAAALPDDEALQALTLIFKAAWADADASEMEGQRTEHGLRAVFNAICGQVS